MRGGVDALDVKWGGGAAHVKWAFEIGMWCLGCEMGELWHNTSVKWGVDACKNFLQLVSGVFHSFEQ